MNPSHCKKVLKEQFPNIDDLADIALSEQNGFDVVRKENIFIQILHTIGCVFIT